MPARGAATRRSAPTPEKSPLDRVRAELAEHDIELHSEAFRNQPLVAKLAAVMGMVGYVPKTGYNDFFRYKYVQESDLVGVIRPLLANAGIMIIPDVIREEWLPEA